MIYHFKTCPICQSSDTVLLALPRCKTMPPTLSHVPYNAIYSVTLYSFYVQDNSALAISKIRSIVHFLLLLIMVAPVL